MSISLQIPYAAPSRSITVRDPELGDGDTISMKTTFHKLMNGSIKSYKYTPTIEKFTWHFIDLTITQAQELEDFLVAAMGVDILLTDFNTNPFKVRCLNDVFEFVTRGKGGGLTTVQEGLEISLEFEVVP